MMDQASSKPAAAKGRRRKGRHRSKHCTAVSVNDPHIHSDSGVAVLDQKGKPARKSKAKAGGADRRREPTAVQQSAQSASRRASFTTEHMEADLCNEVAHAICVHKVHKKKGTKKKHGKRRR